MSTEEVISIDKMLCKSLPIDVFLSQRYQWTYLSDNAFVLRHRNGEVYISRSETKVYFLHIVVRDDQNVTWELVITERCPNRMFALLSSTIDSIKKTDCDCIDEITSTDVLIYKTLN